MCEKCDVNIQEGVLKSISVFSNPSNEDNILISPGHNNNVYDFQWLDTYNAKPSNAETYLKIAAEFAKLSKYDGTKVGCVIIKNGNMISHGINGYPKGLYDNYINSLPRETRLKLAIHAEENALLKLIETGQNAMGSTAYVTHYPCIGCAARMFTSGIRYVYVAKQDKAFMEKWITPNKDSYKLLNGMFISELEIEV